MTQANKSRALVIGLFLFLAAAACAVAPLPLIVRSAGVLLFSYASFAVAGAQLSLLTALVAPLAGLLTGDGDWLVMLPIILASNLLGMLGLEYAWRYAAVIVSPLLQSAPQIVSYALSDQELFEVDLPWGDGGLSWIALHALIALFGVLAALLLDRRQRRSQSGRQAGQPGAA